MKLIEIELSTVTNWQYPFDSLKFVNDQHCFSFDCFYESPTYDMLFCLLSVGEVRMGWYFGRLAILQKKEDPKLFFHFSENFKFQNYFFKDNNSNLYCTAKFHNKIKNKHLEIILVLNLKNKQISYLRTIPPKNKYYTSMKDFFSTNIEASFSNRDFTWFDFSEIEEILLKED